MKNSSLRIEKVYSLNVHKQNNYTIKQSKQKNSKTITIMKKLLGNIYGAKFNETKRENVYDSLEQELNENGLVVSSAVVVRSKLQRRTESGELVYLKNNDGSIAEGNSICLTLASQADPSQTVQTYFRLSRQSQLQPNDSVDIKTLCLITLSRLMDGEREYYDAEKVEATEA